MRVLICGGGVIGAAIAYFLSRRGAEAVVIERAAIAGAASGKSGGFLARDWCDGSPLEQLARRSFDLHAELATRLAGDWGYRRLFTYSGAASARRRLPPRSVPALAWLAPEVIVDARLGSPETTAQVHPGQFTAALIEAARAQGATVWHGQVTGVTTQGDAVTGVRLEGGATIGGDAVVVAMGPWSILATRWLPLPAVFGLKGHSLVFETGNDVPPEALFAQFEEATGEVSQPELFPRRDGTTYVCAISSEAPLPLDPTQVAADAGALERLEEMCRRLSPALAKAPIRARQACYRPVTRDGLPLIGPVPGVRGAYVATGHSVWGILNAPATGAALAELILDGAARSVDLAPFDPARLRPFDPGAGGSTGRADCD